ncbi:MAG: hypothetical protein HY754_05605 [Nitrospirae bacterium]|nr:hypothetical protein [Nitrospirota bacterium]
MKKYITALSVGLIFLLLCSIPFAESRDSKPKIAFVSFIPQSIEVTNLMETIPTIMMMSVEQSGYFEIIEKKKTDSSIELLGFKVGNMKTEDLLAVSGRLNVDFGVWGDISKEGNTVSVRVQLFDIHTGRSCFEHTVNAFESELAVKLKDVSAMLVKNAKGCTPEIEKPSAAGIEPPFDIKATGGLKKVRLKWSHSDAHNLIGFKIFKAKEDNGYYMQIDTVKGTSFIDENLSVNETAYYKIKAVEKTGLESEFSDSIPAKTSITPLPPIFLNVLPGIKGAQLQWRVRFQKNGGTGAAKFRVYRKATKEDDMKEIAAIPVENTTFTDRGLEDNSVYQYAVTALNADNNESDLSSILEVRTFPAVEGLAATSGKIRRVPLKWNLYSYDTAGYRIYRSSEKETGFKQIAQIEGRNKTTYTDSSGLSDISTYWYKIAVFGSDGAETDMSNPVSAVTRDKPPIPIGLTGRGGEARRVSLKWDGINSPDDEIKGYIIYRSTEEKGENKKIGDIDADKNSFVDDDPPLKDNTVYYYSIGSYNSAGVSSSLSNVVSATTKPVPQTPRGLTASSGEVKRSTLKWESNPEADIKEYAIYRRDQGEKDFEKIKTIEKVITYIDADLKDGREYVYAVRAIDSDNLASDLSPYVSAATKPLPQRPQGLKITEQDGKKVVSWEVNPEKDIRHYNVYKKGFLGVSVKLATVLGNSWIINEVKGKVELFVTAVDETELESEGSEVTIVEIIKKGE